MTYSTDFRRRKLDRHAFGRHVSEHPDALQRERAAHFKVSVGSIRHALGRMGATRKKTDPLPRKGIRKQDQVPLGPETKPEAASRPRGLP